MEETPKTYTTSGAIKYGWQIFKENAGLFIGVLALAYGMMFAATIMANIILYFIVPDGAEAPSSISLLVSLPEWIVQFIIQIGLINVTLKFANREKVELTDLFKKWKMIGMYVVTNILTALIMSVGFLLFILPGIYLAVRLAFTDFFLVDKNLSAVDAIKASFGATKGKFWSLFGFFIVLALYNIAGALLLLVGLIVTIPTSMIAMAYVYQTLSGDSAPISKT